jgi:hypothetical protein
MIYGDFTKLHVYVQVGRCCQTTYSPACGQTHAVLQARIVTCAMTQVDLVAAVGHLRPSAAGDALTKAAQSVIFCPVV